MIGRKKKGSDRICAPGGLSLAGQPIVKIREWMNFILLQRVQIPLMAAVVKA